MGKHQNEMLMNTDLASLETLKETAIPKKCCEVFCDSDGYVQSIDTFKIGVAANILGAGRQKLDDKIDFSVGIEVLAKIGAKVSKGQPLVRLFYTNETSYTEAKGLIKEAYKISSQKAGISPLIHHTYA